MAYGFQTSGGSLYIMDPEGRTCRFKRSQGRGHGEWHDAAHCVFTAPVVSPIDIYGPDQRIDLVYAKADRTTERFPYSAGVTLPRPSTCDHVAIIVQNRATKKYGEQVKAVAQPKIGLTPVEKSYTADGFSSVHVGHVITRIFESVVELRDACRAANVGKVPLPVQYVDEWQASPASSRPAAVAISTAHNSQTAKQNFAKQQANVTSGHTTPVTQAGVTPALFKARPKVGFAVGK